MSDYTYPEDRTGTKASNLISGEEHILTPDNNRSFHFIVPKYAPFYAASVKLFKSINGTLLELKEGIDYHFSLEHVSATLSTGKAVYGGISFLNLSLDGTIVIQQYRTVGGQWTLNTQEMLESIANIVFNPRKLTWDQINGRPTTFGPTDHTFDFNNLLTEKQIGDKLKDIRDAVLLAAQTGTDHENRMDNPHNVSAIQLGVGAFYQKGIATINEALAGASPDKVITASVLKAVLETLGLLDLSNSVNNFNEHLSRIDNPHSTISQQLDLDMVENLEVANLSDVLSKRKIRKYITLDNLIDYIRIHGCATVDEDKRKYPVKDSLLSAYCKVRDNMGIYADGYGGTYEKIIENNSATCGYIPPASSPQHAAKGTILTRYCIGFEQHGLYADGYGGTYSNFIAMNSPSCGYTGENSGATHAPAGTILGQYCDGTTQIQTKANGSGGSYEDRVTNSPACKENTSYPPNGTLMSTFCDGTNQMGRYADGKGNTYNAVVQANSSQCGWISPTTAPTQPPITLPPYTPPPVTFLPAGTIISEYCDGSTRIKIKANGSGGTFEERAANSPYCNGGPTPAPTAPPVTFPAAGTIISEYCDGTTRVKVKANGSGGTFEERISNSPQCSGGPTPAPTPSPTPAPTAAPPAGTPGITYQVTNGDIRVGSSDLNIVNLTGYPANAFYSVEFWYQPVSTGIAAKSGTKSGYVDNQGRATVDESTIDQGAVARGSYNCWVVETTKNVSSPKLRKNFIGNMEVSISSNKSFIKGGDTYRISTSINGAAPLTNYTINVMTRTVTGVVETTLVRPVTTNASGAAFDYLDIYYDGAVGTGGVLFAWATIVGQAPRSGEITLSYTANVAATPAPTPAPVAHSCRMVSIRYSDGGRGMFYVSATLNGNTLSGKLTLLNAGAQTELRGLSVPHSEKDFRWIYCTPGAPYSETQANGRDWAYARSTYDLNNLGNDHKGCLMSVVHNAIISGNCTPGLQQQAAGRSHEGGILSVYNFGSLNSNGDFVMQYPIYVPPNYDNGGG